MTCAVVATTRHPPQMVQKDYYALDLNYQARLEQKQNTASLGAAPQVHYDAVTQMVQVKLPEGMVAQSGAANCYRSSTTRDDFSTKFENTSAFDIPTSGLMAGHWHLELDWVSADGKKYFWETPVFISKR